jgi:hypothetical protein
MRFKGVSREKSCAQSRAGFSPVWFIVRREPFYHKLQYSKTPKADPMAAFLGAAVGAFVVYLGLASFGTNGADLSDLTIVVWYSFLFGVFLKSFLQVLAFSLHGGLGFLRSFVHAFLFFFFLTLTFVRRLCVY